MDLNFAISALVALFLLSVLWLFKTRMKDAGKSPPEAAGSRLFTGHLHILSGGDGEVPHVKLAALADDHGAIFGMKLGLRRALVVSSFELAKELFTVHDLKVSSRAGLRACKILSHDYALFGFTPYGSYWRRLRKLVTVELLSSRRTEMVRPVREAETGAAIRALYDLSSSGAPMEMKKWFEDLSFNITLMVVAGKSFCEEEKRRLTDTVKDFFRLVGMFVPADAWPFLRWLDLGGHEKTMKKTAQQMSRIVGQWMEEAERQREKQSDGNKPRNFMEMLLSIPAADVGTERDADAVIRATCENMILGAIDTTSIMLTWALSLLLNHPSALKKAQEELDCKIGRERMINESDLNDLIYLRAIIKETFRLYPATPLSSPREFSEDCVVGGFHVRKGTWLIVNLWKLQRDSRVWTKEPLEFIPERFLDENKDLDFDGHHFELIPFGAGRRMCPGMNMGLQVVTMVLASLIHAFEIKTVDDQPVDMSESAGLTNTKVKPVDVALTPRLARHVYVTDCIEK